MAYLLFNLSIIYTIVCFVMLLKILFKHDWSKKGPARGMFQFFRASTFLFLGMAYIFRYMCRLFTEYFSRYCWLVHCLLPRVYSQCS